MFVSFKDGSGCALDLIRYWRSDPMREGQAMVVITHTDNDTTALEVDDTVEGVSKSILDAQMAARTPWTTYST